jgi:acetate kinase
VKALRVAAAAGDADSELALKVFTRSVRKAIGGFAWLLGGLEAVVFTGGIGEHDAVTRKDCASDLVTDVMVVPAKEDWMIARHVRRMAEAATADPLRG